MDNKEKNNKIIRKERVKEMKKKEIGKVRLGIVASGGGTDANAIMAGWRRGEIPNVSKIILFGTKENAGCFDKAADNGVEACIIECRSISEVTDFNQKLCQQCHERGIELLFLAGCVWEIYTHGHAVLVFNIHPANTIDHGGRHMYGLAVHEHVLLQIRDEIYREVGSVEDNFYTQISVHQVHSSAGVDGGKVFIKLDVPIPKGIIMGLANDADIKGLAKELQKYVLQYEHLILPSAVNILAKMCLDLEIIKGR